MKYLLIIALLFQVNLSFSQPKGGDKSNGVKSTFIIKGQVQEANSSAALSYATVAAFNAQTDKLITGTITDDNGRFNLQSPNKEVYLEVTFLGYETKRVNDIAFTANQANVGIIKLGENAELMDEVVVTGEKSTTEFKLDKRVFNVGKDLSSSGASALEVLDNVPSVNVDIEGAVTLRGSSGVQILINGKPSVLADDESGALGTITAEMIEQVEVVTNPSAKYEAEGTSGIINIILKKSENKGVNGSVSVNVGWPHNHSVGLSLNKRTEKFNLFTQLGVGYKDREFDVLSNNTDKISELSLSSEGMEARNEFYYNVILGSDYYINKLNVITLSGSFTYEIEDQPSNTNFNITDGTNNVESKWVRSESTDATNPKLQYELQYAKEFKDNKDHKLLFSAIGNYFGKKQSSVFSEEILFGTTGGNNQTTATEFEEGKYTFNVDYTKPLNKNWTIETGAQYVDNQVSNDYTVSDLVNGVYEVDEGLTNLFNFDQKVLGVYGTTAYEGEVWGVKVGLRAEQTDLNTLLTNTNEKNSQSFIDLFPSAHTSYKVNERVSLQAGYSRRIYRPRLWDLNPFFNIRNNFNIRTGNPSLTPEYTDSYEVGSIFIYDKVTFNLNAYHRYTTDKIERISSFENNVNVFSPENVGTSSTNGLELNFKYSLVKKLTFNGDANYNYFTREGEYEGQSFDFSNDQWSAKLTSKLKVSKKFDVEASGNYRSKVETVQGYSEDNFHADLGMRYKMLNGKAILNFSVRDVFNTRVRESYTFEDTFDAYSFRQLGRVVSLGFSYGFGKGEAMTYGGAQRRR